MRSQILKLTFSLVTEHVGIKISNIRTKRFQDKVLFIIFKGLSVATLSVLRPKSGSLELGRILTEIVSLANNELANFLQLDR